MLTHCLLLRFPDVHASTIVQASTHPSPSVRRLFGRKLSTRMLAEVTHNSIQSCDSHPQIARFTPSHPFPLPFHISTFASNTTYIPSTTCYHRHHQSFPPQQLSSPRKIREENLTISFLPSPTSTKPQPRPHRPSPSLKQQHAKHHPE